MPSPSVELALALAWRVVLAEKDGKQQRTEGEVTFWFEYDKGDRLSLGSVGL